MKTSICYVNPAFLLRRPISEMISRQEGKRPIGLLIPSRTAEHERQLHHTELFTKAKVMTYPAWQPPGPFEWPLPRPKFFRQGWKALKEYDIIHMWAHFYPSNLLLLLKSLLFKKTKVILTMDTLPGYSFSMGWFMDFLFKTYTWTLGRLVYGIPDRITLYGKALLPHAKRSGINMKKVRVIPTGILPHIIPAKKESREKIEKELTLPKGTKLVLYLGLLNSRKRVEDILTIAEELSQENITFLIAGNGPSRNKLEKKAESMMNIRFLGWRKDVFTLLSAADVFLFPSSAEGLPGAVMEAMLAGTPVVTTRIPCTTDLIRNNKEGILVEVNDVQAMTRNIKRLLSEKRVANKLAKAAKKRIQKEFSWEKALKRYEQLYRELTQ